MASLALSVAGIYTCYLAYGVFQEALYTKQPDGTKFSATTFVLACQCFANLVVAVIGRWLEGRLKKPIAKDGDEKKESLSLGSVLVSGAVVQTSLVYVLAMFASNEALSFVSYPTQALVKSCKMIPVLIGSVLIAGKRYSFLKYLCVTLMTAGILVFQFGKASSQSKQGGDSPGSTIGMLLLLLSLALDGATGPLQETLRRKFPLSNMQQMLVNNFWGCGLMFLASFMMGQFMPAIFVFGTIREFSALTLSTITTTRKIFTILASVLVYGHKLAAAQWIGIGSVFAALVLETFEAGRKSKAKAQS